MKDERYWPPGALVRIKKDFYKIIPDYKDIVMKVSSDGVVMHPSPKPGHTSGFSAVKDIFELAMPDIFSDD